MVLFVIGAVAICALPPLNGFVSEWLIYVGLFGTLDFDSPWGLLVTAAATVSLAMIGALAVACFVRLFGTVFLGSPRSHTSKPAHAPSTSMIIPMAVMALGCVGIGLFPMITAGLLEHAVRTWAASSDSTVSIRAAAPLGWITVTGLVFAMLMGVIVFGLRAISRAHVVSEAGTWDCGYAQPTTRIQYTGSSFGQILVKLFGFILWPKTLWPAVGGIFPGTASFKSIVQDTVLYRLVLPVFNIAGRYLPSLRVLQQGQTHLYVLYILIIVITLLMWGTIGV
jgi:hydrogenase-4 component B